MDISTNMLGDIYVAQCKLFCRLVDDIFNYWATTIIVKNDITRNYFNIILFKVGLEQVETKHVKRSINLINFRGLRCTDFYFEN